MKLRVKTNPGIVKLIDDLKSKSREEGVAIWRDVARRLERPSRIHAEVNLNSINRHTRGGEVVLVPGKVLGSGTLDHPVTVAALYFSKGARKGISEVNGRCLSIRDMIDDNPRGTGIRLMQ